MLIVGIHRRTHTHTHTTTRKHISPSYWATGSACSGVQSSTRSQLNNWRMRRLYQKVCTSVVPDHRDESISFWKMTWVLSQLHELVPFETFKASPRRKKLSWGESCVVLIFKVVIRILPLMATKGQDVVTNFSLMVAHDNLATPECGALRFAFHSSTCHLFLSLYANHLSAEFFFVCFFQHGTPFTPRANCLKAFSIN